MPSYFSTYVLQACKMLTADSYQKAVTFIDTTRNILHTACAINIQWNGPLEEVNPMIEAAMYSMRAVSGSHHTHLHVAVWAALRGPTPAA